jgi:hypothetical protein
VLLNHLPLNSVNWFVSQFSNKIQQSQKILCFWNMMSRFVFVFRKQLLHHVWILLYESLNAFLNDSFVLDILWGVCRLFKFLIETLKRKKIFSTMMQHLPVCYLFICLFVYLFICLFLIQLFDLCFMHYFMIACFISWSRTSNWFLLFLLLLSPFVLINWYDENGRVVNRESWNMWLIISSWRNNFDLKQFKQFWNSIFDGD